MDGAGSSGAHPEAETGCSGTKRFEIELEFVQCLANPHYINWLAQNRHFDDPAFVAYLSYLQYWCQPEYARFLTYPHCLHFLRLLQSADFRKAVANAGIAEDIHKQQYFFWQHHRSAQLRGEAGGSGSAAAGAAGPEPHRTA